MGAVLVHRPWWSLPPGCEHGSVLERWPSGRRRSPAKRVEGDIALPRVQIPPSPQGNIVLYHPEDAEIATSGSRKHRDSSGGRDPLGDQAAEHRKGHGAAAENGVVESLDVEAIPERGPCLLPQAEDLDLASLVGKGLVRHTDVAIDLGLDLVPQGRYLRPGGWRFRDPEGAQNGCSGSREEGHGGHLFMRSSTASTTTSGRSQITMW